MMLLEDSEGPNQTAQMSRLIWAFTVHIRPKTHFHMVRPISDPPRKSIRQTACLPCDQDFCYLFMDSVVML